MRCLACGRSQPALTPSSTHVHLPARLQAEDTDSGHVTTCMSPYNEAIAACISNGTNCVGFNSNCWCVPVGTGSQIAQSLTLPSSPWFHGTICQPSPFLLSDCRLKGSLDTLSQTDLCDLYVKQLPAGQWQLRSNNALCLARADSAAPDLPPLQLANCDASNPLQLFTREQTMTDGAYPPLPSSLLAFYYRST